MRSRLDASNSRFYKYCTYQSNLKVGCEFLHTLFNFQRCRKGGSVESNSSERGGFFGAPGCFLSWFGGSGRLLDALGALLESSLGAFGELLEALGVSWIVLS